MEEKFGINDTMDYLVCSTLNNKYALGYIKESRNKLYQIKLLSMLFDIADYELVNEAIDNAYYYINELKMDKKYLKLLKKVVLGSGMEEFEKDFVSLIVCFEVKSKNIFKLQEYYNKKIHSQINGFNYIEYIEDRIHEYNGKIDTLVLRLTNNTLDKNN